VNRFCLQIGSRRFKAGQDGSPPHKSNAAERKIDAYGGVTDTELHSVAWLKRRKCQSADQHGLDCVAQPAREAAGRAGLRHSPPVVGT
jgi:hypothetical protein